MIENERQLEQTRAALTDLERAVSALKRDVLPLNAARFALMAEAPLADIRELREQVDEYERRKSDSQRTLTESAKE